MAKNDVAPEAIGGNGEETATGDYLSSIINSSTAPWLASIKISKPSQPPPRSGFVFSIPKGGE